MKETTTLYRYEREYINSDDGQLQSHKITLKEYEVWRTTPSGYWINKPRYKSQKGKFILSCKGEGKRFAYATKEQAYNSFSIRTRKSLMHSKTAVKNAEIFFDMIKKGETRRVVGI